jgi:hypothetical protein
MARERPTTTPTTAGQRVRGRLLKQPELELTEEELRALADEGIDPDDVRRAALELPDPLEVSGHDLDTPRDVVEGMTFEIEDD